MKKHFFKISVVLSLAVASLSLFSLNGLAFGSEPELLWGEDGIVVCDIEKGQVSPVSIPDDEGGVVIVWEDRRNNEQNYSSDIYAQRMDSLGFEVWTPGGIEIVAKDGYQKNPYIVRSKPDLGDDGMIITWEDDNFIPGKRSLYGKKIDFNGSTLWEYVYSNVILDSTSSTISDGEGGAYLSWCTKKPNLKTNNPFDFMYELYLLKIDADGKIDEGWPTNGLLISDGGERIISSFKIVSDDNKGAIFIWKTVTNSSTVAGNLYAQRINAAGKFLWNTNGVPLTTLNQVFGSYNVISDCCGGAIIAFGFIPSIGGNAISALKINSKGIVVWGKDGILITPPGFSFSTHPHLVADGIGGAVIVWTETVENYKGMNVNQNIYAQKLNKKGKKMWNENGVPVFTEYGSVGKIDLVKYGDGGTIVLWTGNPEGWLTDYKIFLQLLDNDGSILLNEEGYIINHLGISVRIHSTNFQEDSFIISWQQRNGPMTTYGEYYDIYSQKIKLGSDLIPHNNAPEVYDQLVYMKENTSKNITLKAFDLDGDSLNYSIVAPPKYGKLSGEAPFLKYTPDFDYTGKDRFYYMVDDGINNSNVGIVKIIIEPKPNNPPVAYNQTEVIKQNIPKGFLLKAYDPDGDELNCSIVAPPKHGKLYINGQNAIYVPDNGYLGKDIFRYRASDGKEDSNIASVRIEVKRWEREEQKTINILP